MSRLIHHNNRRVIGAAGGLSLPVDGAKLWIAPDLSDIFADVAGTIPASIDGPVGLVTDLSGNGKNADGANSTYFPTLRSTPSFDCAAPPDFLRFLGTNNYFDYGAGTGATFMFVLSGNYIGIRFCFGHTTFGNNTTFFRFGLSLTQTYISFRNAGAYGYNNFINHGKDLSGTFIVALVFSNDNNIKVYFNNVLTHNVTVTQPLSVIDAINGIYIGAPTASSAWQGEIYEVCAYDSVLSTEDMTALYNYLTRWV